MAKKIVVKDHRGLRQDEWLLRRFSRRVEGYSLDEELVLGLNDSLAPVLFRPFVALEIPIWEQTQLGHLRRLGVFQLEFRFGDADFGRLRDFELLVSYAFSFHVNSKGAGVHNLGTLFFCRGGERTGHKDSRKKK